MGIIKKAIDFFSRHKIFFSFFLIIALIGAFTVPPKVNSLLKGPAENYETQKAGQENLQATVSASGEIEAENKVELKFQTSGRLAWVGVKEGDYVEKWQAVASLDKSELEKTLKKELNDYLNERWDFTDDRETYDIVSDDLNHYTLTDDIRRILEKAQFDLDNKIIDVEIAALAVKYATLTTPIEGIVTEVEAPVAGINITPATATFTVADPASMKFVANVDEADITNIRLGQKVIINLDAFPEESFQGQVDRIAFAAVTTRGGGTAFPIEIKLPENIDERFRIGMNGDAEIILDTRQNTLTVPIEAVKIENGDRYVEIIEGKEIKKVKVVTGLESDNEVEILDGLTSGQIVITGEKEE